jgi:putative selenium metabolism hydrolase
LYGRGACDQKGGLACAVYAGRLLRQMGVPKDVTVWVVASIMEEACEGLCWQHIIEEEGLRPDAVVLTEPTDLNIHRGQRGRLAMKVRTDGLSCHGSAPERGVNAVYRMAPIITEIEELHTRLKDDTFLGKGSVAVADVRSASPSLCAVADSCTIHLDRRLTAGETLESALEEIRRLPAFAKAGAKAWIPDYSEPSYTGVRRTMQSYFPTWVLEEEHPLLRAAIEVYADLFGSQSELGKWMFSTNGVVLKGVYDIPAVGFGPGSETHAHAPNERIPVEHLHKATAFYTEFALNF